MRPSGAHTHPDGGGGLAAIAALVIIGAIIAGPVTRAVGELVHVVLIAAAILAGLAVTSGAAYAAWRCHRRRQPPVILPAAAARPVQARSAPRELPAPPQIHVHLHGPVSAEDLAEVLARHTYQQPAIEERP